MSYKWKKLVEEEFTSVIIRKTPDKSFVLLFPYELEGDLLQTLCFSKSKGYFYKPYQKFMRDTSFVLPQFYEPFREDIEKRFGLTKAIKERNRHKFLKAAKRLT